MNGIMKYINRISRCNGVVYANRLRGYGITQCQHPYILLICREPGIPQEKISRELCVNKRRCVFALTVCFMALLNYYFFAGQAVFCVIYFFVRFFDRRFVNTLKKLLSVAFEAVTGFAMSAVFMLPVLFTCRQARRLPE